MATIAVLGTGLLGTGFVLNLVGKGHTVRVWNRTAAKAEALATAGAVVAATPAEAAAGAERVHLVLAEDAAVDMVIAALRPGLSEGAPIVDHSTNQPAKVAARVARLAGEGVRYLHAPVFMNPRNARDASGIMLIAGPTAEVEALRPALEAMTGKLWHTGERPDGAAVHKLTGNGMLIGLAGLLGDLYTMNDAAGMAPADVDQLFQVFNPAALLGMIGQRVQSGGPRPASFELGMARKDVRLMIETAGGTDGLAVLPGVAAAMDLSIADGRAADDYGVFAWRRRHG
jgi:3-hydroxyisobutyrate dehydrogenase